MVNNWAIPDKNDCGKTWTYFKKAKIKHWGDIKDSRSYINSLFCICQPTSNLDNLDSLTSDVMDTFRVVRETLPQPDDQAVVANVGNFTDVQVYTML